MLTSDYRKTKDDIYSLMLSIVIDCPILAGIARFSRLIGFYCAFCYLNPFRREMFSINLKVILKISTKEDYHMQNSDILKYINHRDNEMFV